MCVSALLCGKRPYLEFVFSCNYFVYTVFYFPGLEVDFCLNLMYIDLIFNNLMTVLVEYPKDENQPSLVSEN